MGLYTKMHNHTVTLYYSEKLGGGENGAERLISVQEKGVVLSPVCIHGRGCSFVPLPCGHTHIVIVLYILA